MVEPSTSKLPSTVILPLTPTPPSTCRAPVFGFPIVFAVVSVMCTGLLKSASPSTFRV